MARYMAICFTILTIGAAYLTYRNVGMQDTEFERASSVRSGSNGGSSSSGGYNSGK